MTKHKRAWTEPNPKHPRNRKNGRFVERGASGAGALAGLSGEKKPLIKLGALSTLPTKKAPKPVEPERVVDPKTGAKIRPLRSDGPFRDVTPEHADRLHERMVGGRPWDRSQVDALVAYTDEDYAPVNTGLRTGEVGPVRAKTAKLRSAMREIPEDIVLHRAADAAAFGYGEDDYIIPEGDVAGLVGRTFSDRGFVSTSVTPRTRDYVEMRISVPAGTRGAYLQSITEYPEEHEMLLDRGTHFKVIKAERKGDRTIMYVMVVGQDD